MARSTIEAPYDVTFPPLCARCMAPATRSMPIQAQKPSASRAWAWFFFGVIGWMIAGGASKENFIRYDIPHCDNCYQQTRRLQMLMWLVLGLVILLSCGGIALASSLSERSSQVSTAVPLLLLFVFVVGGAAIIVLTAVVSSRRPVIIQRVNEKLQTVRLGFLNPSYLDHFRQENLERLVSLGVRTGKMKDVPLEEAIALVSQRIDPEDPRSPASLKGYFERAQLYLQQGAYGQAVSDLDRVIEVTGLENPYFLDAQFFRGQAHMRLGNTVQAQMDLENYLKAASDRGRMAQARQWLKQIRRG
jgi:tetratricopeptide (TPR) repeat protein